MSKVLVFIFLFSGQLILAQNGTPNINFGNNGSVVNPTHIGDATARDILIMPDSSVLVCGEAQGGFFSYYAYLAKHKPNGDLDSTFGVNGTANPFQTIDWNLHKIALQADGKILAAGIKDTYNFAIFRFLSNGELDSNFATHGIFTFEEPWTLGDGYAADIRVKPDGKILVCGEHYRDSAAVVGQLLHTGILDSNFGINGVAKLSFLSANTSVKSMELLPDGTLIFGGSVSINGENKLSLFKCSPDGSLDGSFGEKGLLFLLDSGTAVAEKVLIQNDGKIICVGNQFQNGNKAIAIHRFLANGKADSTFAVSGKEEIMYADFPQSEATDAELLPDQSVLISAKGNYLSDKFMLLKVLSNGQEDFQFGQSGRVISTGDDGLYAVKKADATSFLAAGFTNVSGLNEPLLVSCFYQNSIGMGEEKTRVHFSVYPNPTSTRVILESDFPEQFKLINMHGEEMMRFATTDEPKELQVEGLANGVYFLVSSLHEIQKIVVSR